MITLIEALNYRCLRYNRQPLGPFHVLVGPNSSGKTTFLDVISFLGQLISEGLDFAISERTRNFQDLVWGRGSRLETSAETVSEDNRAGSMPRDSTNEKFELAIEAAIPREAREVLNNSYNTIRYEVCLATDDAGEVVISSERVLFKTETSNSNVQRSMFPAEIQPPRTILTQKTRTKATRTIVNKVPGGNDNFYSEVSQESGKGWAPAFKLGPRKSALGNLPEDESKFPVSTWLKRLLADGVQRINLNSLAMRLASPPGQARRFKPDGSNLPWVIETLRERSPMKFREWIAHVQTALPDIEDIRTIERSDDKHRYLVIRYCEGIDVPSWTASDGTLRLLALTLPAYLTDVKGIYLVEEPENGIHPKAVETIFQSLSSVYDAQILMATHSPVILSVANADHLLCFARTRQGATDIVAGNRHPALRDWKGEVNLSDLFAAGVLG